jgi:hypothetical protein
VFEKSRKFFETKLDRWGRLVFLVIIAAAVANVARVFLSGKHESLTEVWNFVGVLLILLGTSAMALHAFGLPGREETRNEVARRIKRQMRRDASLIRKPAHYNVARENSLPDKILRIIAFALNRQSRQEPQNEIDHFRKR